MRSVEVEAAAPSLSKIDPASEPPISTLLRLGVCVPRGAKGLPESSVKLIPGPEKPDIALWNAAAVEGLVGVTSSALELPAVAFCGI